MKTAPSRRVVAIPVKNEAERLAACLEALNAQDGARLTDIVVLLNDCTDQSAAVARAVALHPETTLHAVEQSMPPGQASAGHARRLAMALAAGIAGPDGVLFTTDADGMVDPDWVSANLQCLSEGADVVAGWVDLHPVEWGQIPALLHEDDARECDYDRLCDAIHACLDPDPHDPEPRHTQHSGASIALTAAAFALCGGVPALACGEDRALIAALRRVDARVRHAPQVHVSVSGRIFGRSEGGMADTIRRRLTQPDEYIDDRLEPALDCMRRAQARAAVRRAWHDGTMGSPTLSQLLRLPAARLLELGQCRFFGEAWEAIEQTSPVLKRRMLRVAELAEQTEAANSILAALRVEVEHPADQSGISPFADVGLAGSRLPQ